MGLCLCLGIQKRFHSRNSVHTRDQFSLNGLGNTVGLFLGLGRLSGKKPIRYSCSTAIEFIRETPLLVHLLWIFYCIPVLTGLSVSAPCSHYCPLYLYIRLPRRNLEGRHQLDRKRTDRGGEGSWNVSLPGHEENCIAPSISTGHSSNDESILCIDQVFLACFLSCGL